ncbi:MAG: GLPGLI family protein [Prevotellaceae bacterium]|nr:GLPGLI family protein [Prevotellaceae bacterium]
MKKICLLLFLSVTVVFVKAQVIKVISPADLVKGDACDEMKYRINYIFKFVDDTTKTPYKPNKEDMLLEIGSKVTSFYSFVAYQSDSINAKAMENGTYDYVVDGIITWRLYKNYPETDKYTYLEKFGMDRFAAIETLETPSWTLCPDSISTILGYTCHLATATYKGRNWSAWYTEDIPISEGPWLLYGLPGLILKAYDSEKQFEFEANGMKQITDSTPIYYKGAKYESIDWETMQGVYKRYYADPVGYITANPKIRSINIQDATGNKLANPKSVPYNLLDRSNIK